MGLKVKVHKDIKEYKEKVFIGMSLKQLTIFLITGVLNVLGTILFVNILKLSIDATSLIMIILSIPLLCLGWFKKDGMTFDVYIQFFIKYLTSPGLKMFTVINKDEGET